MSTRCSSTQDSTAEPDGGAATRRDRLRRRLLINQRILNASTDQIHHVIRTIQLYRSRIRMFTPEPALYRE
jgi:hypothetical protein